MRKLVLASSSQSRQMLLKRLSVPFETISPDINETPFKDEVPSELVKRLALQKAQAVLSQYPDALIIGADQVGVLKNKIIGKPLTIENAKQQLNELSGSRIRFYIGLCLFDSKNKTNQVVLETYDVVFRKLTESVIDSYLEKEQPLQCAGSCKAEGLGIALIEEFSGKDFTALIGLPLIRLTQMLEKVGFTLF